ncbi:tyrosine-type recombinase/integrase [Nocardia sp. NPDC101769]|uniref:tyrosine-type recombinase/integrase n=1 Tax=Nocardia sp. NPDC101769 TaxID=3364333 RepID=UPI00380BF08D
MIPLIVLPNDNGSRQTRDRLELLAALIAAPSFDPLYRDDIIEVPRDHPAFGWGCQVADCERVKMQSTPTCANHHLEWKAAKAEGRSRAEFLAAAQPLTALSGTDPGVCRICPERPAVGGHELCRTHLYAWKVQVERGHTDYEHWIANEPAKPGFGECRCVVCPHRAVSERWGLCFPHHQRFTQQFGTGLDRDVMASAMRKYYVQADPTYRFDLINLRGLPPLVRAEFKWGLYAHAFSQYRRQWDMSRFQSLINICRRHGYLSMAELADHDFKTRGKAKGLEQICNEMVRSLRLIYYSPADTKEAGYIETDHFGRRFERSTSAYDLTFIPQRWLRDLLWDRLAEMLRSPNCPRSRAVFDQTRRGIAELAAFLQLNAPEGGNNPQLLREEHAQQFVADQRYRERHGLHAVATLRWIRDSAPIVTIDQRRNVFNRCRHLLYWAIETGRAAEIGLDYAFAAAIPWGGPDPKKKRNPFSDNVARALADETNLQRLAGLDPLDLGLRDIWEAIVLTGRRCREITELRLDCVGRYGGLPILWHDQTKVGNLNEGIRIPESLYQRIDARREKTITRFEHWNGRLPTATERAALALFPTRVANPDLTRSVSYTYFRKPFRQWVDGLDLPRTVAHQARHTLATNLLRAGASLAHIRRYLGHVSETMAEHYTKVAHSDLEDILQTVWVAGPGSARPGELLSDATTPLSRDEAMALSLDLSRRSTPAEGGFCTFQPVVNGGSCPWKLNCENCDHFVLSGADLLYWRRKQEQWRSIAERAPDDATADYLHKVFDPTARAIEGLEKALAGLGLLEEALQMDLRRPQDYFHRIWSTTFRATELAELEINSSGSDSDPETT